MYLFVSVFQANLLVGSICSVAERRVEGTILEDKYIDQLKVDI